jgi:hypothetical protein
MTSGWLYRMNDAGLIPSTTYAIQPSLYNYMRGTLFVGGYNSSDIFNNTLACIPSPGESSFFESWFTGVFDIKINGTSVLAAVNQAEFITGYDYIGLNDQTFNALSLF